METKVSFKSGNISLSGTLSTPKKETNSAVLLVPGSGMQDRDETFGENNKTFKEISEHLTKNGLATLRYDKRGSFESGGDYKRATLHDFVKDATAGLNLLSKKFSKLFILGHSEGALVAVLVASKEKVDGIILLAPANLPVDKMVAKQFQLLHKSVPAQVPLHIIKDHKKWMKDVKNGIYTTYSDYFSRDSKLPRWIQESNKINPQPPEYWRSHFESDIRKKIKTVEIPILILNGKLDFLVNYKDTEILNFMIKNKDCTLELFDNLCHRFVKVKDFEEGLKVDLGQYPNKRLAFDKKVLKNISDWIRNLSIKKR